jgi:hypothetical protein
MLYLDKIIPSWLFLLLFLHGLLMLKLAMSMILIILTSFSNSQLTAKQFPITLSMLAF